MSNGSFNLAEMLFTYGDESFLAELRKVQAVEQLGKFAAKWLNDSRPVARQYLFDYLTRPLACYRHEALVKRLFKLAEAKQDDELMGAFLVAFDRLIRRVKRRRTQHKWDRLRSIEEVQAREKEWQAAGFENISRQQFNRNQWQLYASRTYDAIVQPNNTMPRPVGKSTWTRAQYMTPEMIEKRFVLFSFKTRRYLRRRAWRYFRLIGKKDPARYLKAAVNYLKRYRDTDASSEINLLDNWGLVHTLFRDSPGLLRPPMGWEFATGKSISDLRPAPYLAEVWKAHPEALLEVLTQAECRTVRQWAIALLRQDHLEWLANQSVSVLLTLVDSSDTDVAAIGFDLIERHPDLASVPVQDWLKRLDGDNFEKLQRLSTLLQKKLDPTRISFETALKLTCHRSLPVAKLGLTLLQSRSLSTSEIPALLTLVQAESSSVRPELIPWLRDILTRLAPLRSEWLLDFLDSKFHDVRQVGWRWLQESAFKDDPSVWQKLLESPYDDIRGPLIEQLALRTQGANPSTVQLLWATVLLNIHRGGRFKPGVVAQVVTQLDRQPEQSAQLLPILSVAVRSLRGPEFRAGLTGLVNLIERRPELTPLVESQFPELKLSAI
jgi:hypothetical protein